MFYVFLYKKIKLSKAIMYYLIDVKIESNPITE